MKKNRLISYILSLFMLTCSAASAADFSDMPTDPAEKAVIENSVKNGILSGSDGMVRPNAYITRAEMASIITRACGANEEGNISRFNDVNPEKWYYSAVAKAYKMGALSGSDNKMNPESYITFQECFTVLSKVFDLVPEYSIGGSYSESELPPNTVLDGKRLYDLSLLTQFNDAQNVADWAKIYVAGVVYNGGWNGINGNLTPNNNITRLQFATVMDNLFKNYIDTPGTYNSLPAGNTLIRCDGVILEGVKTEDDIYIADSVSPNGITINDVQTTGRLVVRGCATPTVDENGGVKFGQCGIVITGHFDKVRIIRPYINLDMRGATYDKIYSIPNTSVSANMKM